MSGWQGRELLSPGQAGAVLRGARAAQLTAGCPGGSSGAAVPWLHWRLRASKQVLFL